MIWVYEYFSMTLFYLFFGGIKNKLKIAVWHNDNSLFLRILRDGHAISHSCILFYLLTSSMQGCLLSLPVLTNSPFSSPFSLSCLFLTSSLICIRWYLFAELIICLCTYWVIVDLWMNISNPFGHLKIGAGLCFIGLIHYYHDGKHGGMQVDTVLEG